MLLYQNACIFGSRVAFFYYVIFQLMDLSFFGKPSHLGLNCMVPSHVHKLPLKPVWEIVWVCFILISRLGLVNPCRMKAHDSEIHGCMDKPDIFQLLGVITMEECR